MPLVLPHARIGFYDPIEKGMLIIKTTDLFTSLTEFKDLDRKTLGFIDHDTRDQREDLENRMTKLKYKDPENPKVKADTARTQKLLEQSITAIDVVGWLCIVYDLAITNSKDRRHDKWQGEVKEIWEQINFHWNEIPPRLRDRLEIYYQKLLKISELGLIDDRSASGGEQGGTTTLEL